MRHDVEEFVMKQQTINPSARLFLSHSLSLSFLSPRGSRTNIQLFSAQQRRSDYKLTSLSAVVIFTLAPLGGQPNSMIPVVSRCRPSAANSPSPATLRNICRTSQGITNISYARNDLSINRIPALAHIKSNFRRGLGPSAV